MSRIFVRLNGLAVNLNLVPFITRSKLKNGLPSTYTVHGAYGYKDMIVCCNKDNDPTKPWDEDFSQVDFLYQHAAVVPRSDRDPGTKHQKKMTESWDGSPSDDSRTASKSKQSTSDYWTQRTKEKKDDEFDW